MKQNENVIKVLRIFLGVFLILYALNKFFHIIPTGYGEMNENTQDFIDGVAVYLPYLYIFEIIIGLLLISNIWTPFLLIVLFPLSVVFVIFVLANGDFVELWPAFIVAALNVILLIAHKDKYQPLFS
jgi:uncharacterized membrane protein YphA (DoxX/SURF4 family)